MSFRELAGLVLLIAAVAVAPFGYWLGFGWALVSLALGIPGGALYFSARVSRKSLHDDTGVPDVYPGHELRGFHGADVFDQDD
jgi:uncharacterized membrane protein